MNRRQTLKTLAATSVMPAAIVAPYVRAADTFKIGVLASYSGMSSIAGRGVDGTLKLFAETFGDSVAGRKVEIIRRDTTGPNPDVAKRMTQELIVREKVQIMLGPDFTPNTLAVAPLITEAKMPSFVTGSATSGIVDKSPYNVRTFFAVPQVIRPLAEWCAKSNIKTVFSVVADYGPGQDSEAFFKEAFSAKGGTVVGALRIPVQNPEFSSHMQRIKDVKPDAVFVFVPIGQLSTAFLRAYDAAGLRGLGIQLISTGDLTDESYLDSAGDAAIGTVTSGIYSTQHPSALNEKFVKSYYAANGPSPRIGWGNLAVWDAMQLVYQGVAAQGSKSFDPDAFMAFTKGRTIESPRGPITIDKVTGDITQNVYMRRTERRESTLQNVEFETYTAVAPK